jgi:hypothetical protein
MLLAKQYKPLKANRSRAEDIRKTSIIHEERVALEMPRDRSSPLSSPDVEPSRRYYALAALIFLAGATLSAWFLFASLTSLGGQLQQFSAPGSAEIHLEERGEYTIFFEEETYFNATFYSAEQNLSGLRIEVRERQTGQKLPVYSPAGSFTYSLGGRTGRSIAAFTADRPGVYEISAFYKDQGPEVVLAVGQGLFGGIFSDVLAFLALFLGSMAVAGAISLTTYRRRQEAWARRREEERIVRGEKRDAAEEGRK